MTKPLFHKKTLKNIKTYEEGSDILQKYLVVSTLIFHLG